MSDPSPPNNGNLNSWSIPKKSSSTAPLESSGGLSMDTVVPRKSTFNNSVRGNSPLSMQQSIPKKNPGHPGGGLTGSIPRKNQTGSFSGLKPSLQHGTGGSHLPSMGSAIPRRNSHRNNDHPNPEDRTTSGQQRLSPACRDYNILSVSPFRIRIDLKGVDLTSGGITQSKTKPSERAPGGRPRARDRPDYHESEDFDSEEDILVDSSDDEDHDYGRSKKKRSTSTKKIKIKKGRKSPIDSSDDAEVDAPSSISATIKAQLVVGPSVDNIDAIPSTAFLDLGNTSVESPPPGTLPTLWYSREVFVNVYVVEKILAWKTRHVTQLEWVPESYTDETKPMSPPFIDPAEAAKYSNRALANPLIWRDPSKRMEVSRLNHQDCPIVMTMAAHAQLREDQEPRADPGTEIRKELESTVPMEIENHVQQDSDLPIAGQSTVATDGSSVYPPTIQPKYPVSVASSTTPIFRVKQVSPDTEVEREEVYLVKWRGKSYLHVSWERGSDIIRYDQSNSTARNKIQRFVQSQEIAFGLNWKKVLEEERSAGTNIHIHGDTGKDIDDGTSEAGDEEYYPPAVTEVERILACDESEMDLSLYAKQRALNILDEQAKVQEKESGTIKRWNSKEGLDDLLSERPWDPEDNVRFVVKWKGLPFADLTWEYWRDIKRDAVDEAEDFWMRQQPPSEEVIAESSRPHPHMQFFKKIQESPIFGLSKRKRDIAKVVDCKNVPIEEEAEREGFRLRNYQLEGVNWLLFNWWNKRSCILADEMGLGKTIQSVGFLKVLQDLPATKIRGPFLIVAPLSLIGQWQSEARTWAPDLNVVLYHGRADARDFLIKQDFFFTDQFVSPARAKKLRKQHVTKFHILITTYEVVMKDIDVFKKIRWRALIVDEAHRLKNPKAKLFEELSSVPRDHCVLLTGTPLANATEELWALLHFANPVSFSSKEEFLEKFGQLTDANQVNELHAVLKPYLLRRVKEDVEKSLPPKEEIILEVTLTPIQKKFYKAIYERNTSFLFKGAKPSNSPSLMNVMMELRKCCNHPFLIRGAEERILADATEQAIASHAKGTSPAIDQYKIFAEQLVKSSGKMVLLNKLLPKLYANGHKVLIFSQMVRALDLMEELLKINRYKYERLDGSTSSASRAAAVERFIRKSCQRFVMLLSTRAGGLGLNLTAADVIIIADSDWNPQNDLQAMARAHRIGQTRAVRVYRLLTAKTYEMHMFHSASMKLGLERAVLSQQREQGNDGDGGKTKSKKEKEAQAKEIDELLKKGAYDVFRDDNDEEAKKFMETDIDQLMESSAKTVTYGKQESNLSSGLGSFSKASFVTDTGDGEKDVDLDDPDFWSKAVGLDKPVEIPEEISQMIDDGVKRSRKQVQQFDPYAEWVEEEDKRQAEIERKMQAEKEEKQRIKAEKKRLKEKKRKDRGERDGDFSLEYPSKKMTDNASEINFFTSRTGLDSDDLIQESFKSSKGSNRKRAILQLEQRDPAIEQLRQAWDISHRNRAVAACLRFGLSRLSKIRHESGLQSLPIHDVEVFCRSYIFQQSLQAAVLFMEMVHGGDEKLSDEAIQNFLGECIGHASAKELEFLSECLGEGIRYFWEVENNRRVLRMPQIFAEASYMADLRRGHALRALRRIHMVCRVERVVSDCVADTMDELGYEQLAQRGCQTSIISSLSLDLTSRLVSMEELFLCMNTRIRSLKHNPPSVWWDRNCDIGLILGTFIHGLGNYESMLNDEALPFAQKLKNYVAADCLSSDAHRRFVSAGSAAKGVCDAALEASKLKAQKEVQKAVAAAAAASTEREKDAAKLRDGIADDQLIYNMSEQKIDNLYEIEGGRDSHFITLPRVRSSLISTLRGMAMPTDDLSSDFGGDQQGSGELKIRRRLSSRLSLSMPDARILNFRLGLLLSSIDKEYYGEDDSGESDKYAWTPKIWPSSEEVSKFWKMRELRPFRDETAELAAEYAGIGMAGTQCGATHRTIDDRSDFSIAAANADLYQVAQGPDSARYLRALGVPMSFGRFALLGLLQAEEHCLFTMLNNEKWKYFGQENPSADPSKGKEIFDGKDLSLDSTPAKVGSPFVSNEVQGSRSVYGEEQAMNNADNKKVQETIAKPLPDVIHESKGGIIPDAFRASAELRAGICILVCYFGFPTARTDGISVNKSFWTANLREQERHENAPSRHLFNPSRFRSLLADQCSGMEIPGWDVIVEYVQNALLPHCLKLCIYGNGSSTTDARGSKGKYETFDGSSRYIEPTDKLQSPLPDPCLLMKEQSIEAVGMACAILRRNRLMQSIANIACGDVQFDELIRISKSPVFRQSMDGLPVWWCPWIHDIALLAHASTRGLFAILQDRKRDHMVDGTPLSSQAISQHIQSTFFADDTTIPKIVTAKSTADEKVAWAAICAEEFPSMNVIERRLSFLCALATENLDGDKRFENLPMYDHGAWPRN